MTSHDLPITITHEQRENKYISSLLASEAFRAAGYDLTPENDPVTKALERGLLRMVPDTVKTDSDEAPGGIAVL